MRSPLRHPLVLLDAGGTLIGPRRSFGAVYSEVFARHGVALPAAAWEGGLRTTWHETNRAIPAGVDRYGFWPGGEKEYWLRFVEGTLERTPGAPRGRAVAAEALDALRDAFRDPMAWEVFDDVVPVLESLRSAGAKLAVVSNWDSRLPALLERLGLERHVDLIVVSHLEGWEKPRPELFLRALERLGGRPGDALHIGDTPELDVAGATAAGIARVLVDRTGRAAPGTAALPDLRALPEIARDGIGG